MLSTLSLCSRLRYIQAPELYRAGLPLPTARRRSKVTSPTVMQSEQGNGATSAATQDESVTFLPDGSLTKRTKLSIVVKDALRRWYLETEKEAYRGDVKAQALLGQMLIEGYGCKADPDKGREWVDKARRRGYRMQGVYCQL